MDRKWVKVSVLLLSLTLVMGFFWPLQEPSPEELEKIKQQYENQLRGNVEVQGSLSEGDLVYGEGSYYDRWIEKLKPELPVIEDYQVEDLLTVPVHFWEHMGVPVAYIRFTDFARKRALQREILVLEIPPGGSVKRHRHLYEEVQVVLSGKGYTELQQEGRRVQRLDWQQGSFFATPLNAWHQHFNSGNTPLRILMVTTAPVMIGAFGNREVAYSSNYVFRDRYNSEEDFARENVNLKTQNLGVQTDRYWYRNFVSDLKQVAITPRPYRGVGAGQIEWLMGGNNVLVTHMSEFPVGVYRKGHQHGGGPLLFIVSGHGYSVFWEDSKFEDRKRVNWRTGSLVAVPPGLWYHQHFNTSTETVRYLAIRGGTPRGMNADRGNGGSPPQIDYKDEDPRIRAEFVAELKKSGAPLRMPEF